ncbi:D123-domain-containing protein [Pavlovales sp. CCMP2436]|nr:D123-domain-containing protein [Pavlovales sp. CCMP2436]
MAATETCEANLYTAVSNSCTMASHEDLRACSFDAWYPRLRRVSIKSRVLELPAGFVDYLLEDSDGIFIPPPSAGGSGGGSTGWSDEEDGVDSADEPTPPPVFGFDMDGLFAQVDAAIAALGGVAFPKMNWSSPRDSAWVLGGSLKCVGARDVVTLLKCSQHVAHDLHEHAAALGGGDDGAAWGRWVLVLRSWSNLHPAGEFRCFVRDGVAFAICQRDRFTHYAHLEAEREELLERLGNFVHACLGSDAEFGVGGRACAVDVYVDSGKRVHLLDLSPFAEATTDPLLFSWAELAEFAARARSDDVRNESELRLVGADAAVGVRPSATMYAGIPLELQPGMASAAEDDGVGAVSGGGEGQGADVTSAVELMRSALQLDELH